MGDTIAPMFRRFLRIPGAPAGTPRTAADRSAAVAETATVRRIIARLEALPAEEARYLAGFAYVMSRAAQADLDISDAETQVIERAVLDLGGLDEAQAVLVVQLAKLQARGQGETEDFVVTREFGKIATHDQKLALLRCCFLVAVADGSVSAEEASVVNEIARELDVPRHDLNRVRDEFVDRFSAIQSLRRQSESAG
jgi:uncharacterized tellurite resistance protein B-like protein